MAIHEWPRGQRPREKLEERGPSAWSDAELSAHCVGTDALNGPTKLIITLEVFNDSQARELYVAWWEVVSGTKLVRGEVLEDGVEALTERACAVLEMLETMIRVQEWIESYGRD